MAGRHRLKEQVDIGQNGRRTQVVKAGRQGSWAEGIIRPKQNEDPGKYTKAAIQVG